MNFYVILFFASLKSIISYFSIDNNRIYETCIKNFHNSFIIYLNPCFHFLLNGTEFEISFSNKHF